MVLKVKKVLVVGAGKTGVAAARVLQGMGSEVVVCDIKRKYLLEETYDELVSIPVAVHSGGYPDVTEQNTDLIIMSPGVPFTIPPVIQAEAAGIPVWSEIELAFRMFNAPITAITGTNGKTTTTALTGAIIENSGRPTIVAGNIGVPLIEKVKLVTPDHQVVVEASSFQLQCIRTFRPRVAVVLNLTPDHLDRHETFENYIEAKKRIFCNQTDQDYTVLNYDDANARAMAAETRGKVIFFSLRHTLKEGAYLFGGSIYLTLDGKTARLCGRDEIGIKGDHNTENVLAASVAAGLAGVDPETIAGTLKKFKGVEHRLEFVEEIAGVKYVNDSKGTNPDASIKAIAAFEEPIVLIAGGKNKGSDFGEIASRIKDKVRVLIVLGEAADNIVEAVEAAGFKNWFKVASLEEAVAKASEMAVEGEVVLLSPACASWDMFRNYEERGNLFKQLVCALRGR